MKGTSISPYRTVLTLLTVILMSFLAAPAQNLREQKPPLESKEIAITIDDLPLNGPQFSADRLRAMTGKILAAINKYQVPAVGFVNESLLYLPNETDARIAILK